jgi:hypothetical protein
MKIVALVTSLHATYPYDFLQWRRHVSTHSALFTFLSTYPLFAWQCFMKCRKKLCLHVLQWADMWHDVDIAENSSIGRLLWPWRDFTFLFLSLSTEIVAWRPDRSQGKLFSSEALSYRRPSDIGLQMQQKRCNSLAGRQTGRYSVMPAEMALFME